MGDEFVPPVRQDRSDAERQTAKAEGRNRVPSAQRRVVPTTLTSGDRMVQTRLRVGAAGDRMERDADAVADHVMRHLDRWPGGLVECAADQPIRRAVRAEAVGAEGGELSDDAHGEIRRAEGGGQPLAADTRTAMESAFGADFGRIRLHTDATADRLSRQLSAAAFTTGADVFFRGGAYQPATRAGARLLAHELAHTVQQGAATTTSSRIQRSTAARTLRGRLEANEESESGRKRVIRRAILPSATSGLDKDLDTNERTEFAERIIKVSDPAKLRAIKALVEAEQKTKGIDPATEMSNLYALGSIRDRLDWLASDRRHGDLDPLGASPYTYVPDAKIGIAKKAPLSDPSDKSPDLLFINSGATLFGAGLESVDVGGGKIEQLPIPDHGHFAAAFNKTDNPIGNVSTGQFAITAGNWFTSPYRGCVGPFWAVAPVPDRDPFKPWFPHSITVPDPPGFAALLKGAANPFVITNGPIPGATFEPSTVDLFPRLPKRDDVHQGELADCGLLAILAGIVTREPWFIQQMMRDLGNGKVMVRLFDIRVNDDTTWSFTPRFVGVDKSVVVRAHSDLFGQTQADNRGALWVPIVEKAYVAAGYLATSMERTGMMAVANTEGANMDFVYGHVRGEKADVTDTEAAAKPAPGARRSKKYSPATAKWFDKIGLALQDRKVVVLETVAQIAKGPLGVGHSGGEPKAKGLVGSHAYTAIATASEGDRLFIRVRNPWGKYGRAYDWGAVKGGVAKVDEDAGEFLIELNDAVKRFSKVMISGT